MVLFHNLINLSNYHGSHFSSYRIWAPYLSAEAVSSQIPENMVFFWWPACSLQWSRWFSCFSSLMSGLVSVQLLLQTALVDLWLVLLEPCWWAFEVWLVLIGRLLPRPWWWWLWPFSGLLVKPLLEAGPPHGLSQVGGRPLHQLTCSPSREFSPAPKFSPAPRELSPAPMRIFTCLSNRILQNCPREFSKSCKKFSMYV